MEAWRLDELKIMILMCIIWFDNVLHGCLHALADGYANILRDGNVKVEQNLRMQLHAVVSRLCHQFSYSLS